MNLMASRPPHVRSRESNFSVMSDVVIALLPLYVMAYFFYGSQVVTLGGVSVAVCLVLDYGITFLSSRRVSLPDLSPVITGMMIPLMLPSTVPLMTVIVADIFAIAVVKQPFGGLGQNIFNPAAAGVAFAILTWPDVVFQYTAPIESLGATVARYVTSPGAYLRLGATPTYPATDVFLGIYPGPMGATGILILAACLVYLSVRKTVNYRTTLSFLGAAAVVAFLFPRVTTGRFDSVFYELTSGILLFGSIFLINDPTTSPKSQATKMIYGAASGVLTMVFRYFGAYEEGMVFAVLLINAFSLLIDLQYEKIRHKERRLRHEEQEQTETI